MKFFLEKEKECWIGKFTHFSKCDIIHGISTRFTGLSSCEFSSLNLAMHNGDDNKIVAKNRKIFAHSMNIVAKDIVTAKQTHSDNIVIVTEDMKGQGAEDYLSALDDTDALITNVKNIPLMMFFADCVPVLFFDPINTVIAISHAGWKGTVAKIAQKTLLAMQDNFNTNPQDVLVGIAPSIGSCCYKIGIEVISKVKESFPIHNEALLLNKNGETFLDLWQANKEQLLEIGVRTENLIISDVCTNCNSEMFFSYRADHGKTGRIAAIMSLK